MRIPFPRLSGGFIAFTLLFALHAYAVGPTGKIVGTVTASGQAVPGAKVTVTNPSTNEARVETSDESGNFTFPVLGVGTYTVKVEAAGFQTFEQKDVILQVDQNVSITSELQVGATTTVVEVTGAQPTIDLVDATVSHVVDQERIVDLPLNGRDTLQLQYIMPGVSYDNDNVSHGQGQHEGTVVNGNRPGSNYYLLDGVDMTDSYLSTAPIFPAPDALQEFDIQTSNYTAQYGRSSGGLVNVATRAGSNQFHGGLFEFFRNTVLDSHNYFDTPGSPKPSFKLNQYGGDLGGPIFKDKMFFFGYYQGTRQRKDETVTIGTVLTQQERPDLNGGSATFPGAIDPQTNLPFPGGFIPANRIDPTAVNFIKTIMPLPNNSSGGYTFNAPVANNEDSLNEDQFLGRIDRNFGEKNLLFGHYFYNQDTSTGIGAGGTSAPALTHQKYFRNQNIAIDYTHTFNPNLINTAVLGFTRVAHHREPLKSVGWGAFGGPATTSAAGVASDLYTDINGSINAGGDGDFVQNRQTFQYTDYVSLTRGRHSMSFGADLRKEATNRTEDFFTDPDFTFNGQYSGNALSDLLLGLPNYYNLQTEVKSRLRHNAFDVFAQDNYKITQKVTIDAGIRWEPFLPPVDNLNDQICYDPTFTKKSAYYPTAPPGILFPGPPHGEGSLGKGDPGCPRSMVPNRWKNVTPRIGVNVNPFGNGKTSIRASFGLFYDQARLIAWNRFSTAQPFDDSVIVNGPAVLEPSLTGNNIYANSNGVINPYPFVIPRTPAQRAAFSPSYGGNWPTAAGETVVTPKFNEGYANQWNLTIDQEFAPGWTATVSYIGNHGTHLFQSRENNYAPISSYDRTLTEAQNNTNLPQRRRLAAIQCGTGQGGATAACYGPMEILDSNLWSNYNSLQASVTHRFEHGFSLLASYVWGRYLDVISYTAEGGNGPRDPNDYRLSYGPSDNDVRNRFAASYIYALPKLSSLHGFASALINDWQNQGIITAQSGRPYSIGSSLDTAATGIGGDTADLTGAIIKPANRGVAAYFNPAAFQNAAPGTVGQTGRNFLTGPDLVNVDFSLFKEFPVHEIGKIQFRGEFFNLFNHPNYYTPDNTVGDGTFGRLQSAHDPRIAQFALKLLF